MLGALVSTKIMQCLIFEKGMSGTCEFQLGSDILFLMDTHNVSERAKSEGVWTVESRFVPEQKRCHWSTDNVGFVMCKRRWTDKSECFTSIRLMDSSVDPFYGLHDRFVIWCVIFLGIFDMVLEHVLCHWSVHYHWYIVVARKLGHWYSRTWHILEQVIGIPLRQNHCQWLLLYFPSPTAPLSWFLLYSQRCPRSFPVR